MRIIELTQGKVALVDDTDYERLNQWKWCYHRTGYAVRNEKKAIKKTIYMHRTILETPDGMCTDHINGDKLDNRRENMRICNNSQNLANRPIPINNTSGIKGVCWNKNHKKWHAKIEICGKQLYIGAFDDPSTASNAYNKKAKELFGEYTYKDT